MEASNSRYSHARSIERIDEVLNSSDANYEEKDSIPTRNSLTFNNGYYVSCTALFVDIRDSKSLNDKHSRPVRAKILKTYISETVAVLKDHSKVSEIYIEGDGVWAIFDTPYTKDIDEAFTTAAKCASLVDTLNVKYRKKNYSEIRVGIGLSYGTSLLVKAGYKGSGINEVVWLGKLVAEAAELCSYGSRFFGDRRIMMSGVFRQNLNDHNMSLTDFNQNRNCYHSDAVNVDMDKWVQENG